jgi:hypothetical protein
MASSDHNLRDPAPLNANAEFMRLRSRDLWRAINQKAFDADITWAAASAVNRIWLLIGESNEQTAEALLSLGVLASDPVLPDVRIMLTPSTYSGKTNVQLKHYGFSDNVRATSAKVRGWLAITDAKAYCHFQESGIGARKEGRWWFPRRRRPCEVLLLDANTAPSPFRTLETYYKQLWESANLVTPRPNGSSAAP